MLLDHKRNRHVVDGVRAIGILLVILFHVMFGTVKLLQEYGETHDDYSGLDHYVADYPEVLNIAWQALGSEVVFVISGFLLSYLLFRELRGSGRVDYRDYLVRRVSRILPMYFLALFLFALAARFEWWELGLNLVFLSKVFGAETIIPVGWSLEVMIQVYLLLPALCLVVYRARWPVALTLGLVALSLVPRFVALATHPADAAMPFHELVYGGDASHTQKELYYLLLHRATPFLFGLFLAYLCVEREELMKRIFERPGVGIASTLVGAALVASSGFLPIHDPLSFLYTRLDVEFWTWFWTFQRAVFTVGIALLLLPAFYATRGPGQWLGNVLAWELWRPVSRNIYGIYLFHFACLIPAAAIVLIVLRPDRWHFVASQPGDLDEVIDSISNLESLGIFVLTAFFSVKFAGFLTRRIELPAQAALRKRFGREADVALEPKRRPA